MRIDYRNYREPVVHLDLPRPGRRLALVAVLFSAPVNSARRWFGIGGIGVQPSELAKLARDLLHRRAARAAHAPHQRGRRTRCCRSASSSAALVGLILLEPDFGTAMSLAADRRGDGVRRRPATTATSSAPLLAALPVVYIVAMSADYRRRRLAGVSRTRGTTRSATASRSSSR